MPCPAFGLWVWQASPAMNTLGSRAAISSPGHVIELVGQALADLINRPPGDFLHLEPIRIENPPRLRDQLINGDIAACDPFADFEFGDLNIEADEVAAFPRDDEDAALIGRLDQ